MTKKKLRFLILAGILAMYFICTCVNFSTAQDVTAIQFSTASQNFEDTVHNDLVSFEGTDELDYVLSQRCLFDYYTDYPYTVGIYDKNGKLLVSSGSCIVYAGETQDEYINVEKYMTDDIKQQIQEFINCDSVVNYMCVSRFDYSIVDGEIIPVSMVITDEYLPNQCNGKSITIKLSNNEIQHTILYGDNGDENAIYTQMMHVFLYNFDQSWYNSLYYDKLDGIANVKVGQYQSVSGALYSSEELTSNHTTIATNGNEYVVYLKVYHNIYLTTLFSDVFEMNMFSQTILFIVVAVVIFIISEKLYNKNKALNDAKMAFTGGVAHELKTPLAIIQNQCECILENVAPQKNDDYIKSIYDESLRMNELVSSMLQYNRLASANDIKLEQCSLADIVNDEIQKYSAPVVAKNITLHKSICDMAYVDCNKELIALVLDNFLSNAVKHTDNGCYIKVSITKQNSGYKVAVFNEGKQIDYTLEKKLWDIFYTQDKARTSANKTSGMGLAISKQILTLHKYKFGFENKPNGVEFFFVTK